MCFIFCMAPLSLVKWRLINTSDWLIDWLICRLVGWLIDWLIWLNVRPTCRPGRLHAVPVIRNVMCLPAESAQKPSAENTLFSHRTMSPSAYTRRFTLCYHRTLLVTVIWSRTLSPPLFKRSHAYYHEYVLHDSANAAWLWNSLSPPLRQHDMTYRQEDSYIILCYTR